MYRVLGGEVGETSSRSMQLRRQQKRPEGGSCDLIVDRSEDGEEKHRGEENSEVLNLSD